MCRVAAWIGAPIALEEVVIAPPHSLLAQSQDAAEAKLAVNGDGFWIAWYRAHDERTADKQAIGRGSIATSCRHASDEKRPTLYQRRTGTGVVIASEPLDAYSANWNAVSPDQLLCVTGGSAQSMLLVQAVNAA